MNRAKYQEVIIGAQGTTRAACGAHRSEAVLFQPSGLIYGQARK